MSSSIVVHYGEIGIKGANRPIFEKSLERNIRSSLRGLDGLRVKKVNQRFFVTVEDGMVSEARERLARVFGVAWYAKVENVPLSYPAILETAVRVLDGCERDSTFRVSARRSDKSFDMSSQDVARKLGEDIIARLGLKVNLSQPETTLFVDIVRDQAIVYREHVRGPGGLPVGSSGRVLHLLSGGIDSPVAAWLMMKRGCRPTFLHFYLAPGPQSVLDSKVVDLVRSLGRYGGDSQLILIPFAPYQLATVGLPSEYEPIVFRRFVRMVAELVSADLGYPAISTGDNLAQVASQTLQNLVCIDSGSAVPTFRPVLGYDKEEIVQLAKVIGTYEISLREYKDCCSIVSRHPRTRMKVKDVDESCSRFNFDELARRCVSMGDIVTVAADQTTVKPLARLLEEVGGVKPEQVAS
ncbi:MAG: tRNA 4-thiouridine(8) synthase ThiI [Thaumarchaeota archaeon]|nr:tRNA 4-thiouridine(8) synthase ThiI [Nitrososphaerota archaeon]